MSVSMAPIVKKVVEPLLAANRPGCPGVVVDYDPVKRRAKVQPQGRLLIDGKETPMGAADMPVAFGGGGGFTVVYDLKKGDPGWCAFSFFPIKEWKTDGAQHLVPPGQDGYGDAVFYPGVRDYGHPGISCPRGCMVIGAENGPRITWDNGRLAIDLTALQEITIAAGARIILKALSVIIDGVLRTS